MWQRAFKNLFNSLGELESINVNTENHESKFKSIYLLAEKNKVNHVWKDHNGSMIICTEGCTESDAGHEAE